MTQEELSDEVTSLRDRQLRAARRLKKIEITKNEIIELLIELQGYSLANLSLQNQAKRYSLDYDVIAKDLVEPEIIIDLEHLEAASQISVGLLIAGPRKIHLPTSPMDLVN